MTSYWKRRWPNTVLFGSFRELNYRIDVTSRGAAAFRIKTGSGLGFSAEIARSAKPPGYSVLLAGEGSEIWLERKDCRDALADLLRIHFSRISASPDSLECLCVPSADDLLPEGRQLTWCMSLVHLLWSAAPADSRKYMAKSDFLE